MSKEYLLPRRTPVLSGAKSSSSSYIDQGARSNPAFIAQGWHLFCPEHTSAHWTRWRPTFSRTRSTSTFTGGGLEQGVSPASYGQGTHEITSASNGRSVHLFSLAKRKLGNFWSHFIPVLSKAGFHLCFQWPMCAPYLCIIFLPWYSPALV